MKNLNRIFVSLVVALAVTLFINSSWSENDIVRSAAYSTVSSVVIDSSLLQKEADVIHRYSSSVFASLKSSNTGTFHNSTSVVTWLIVSGALPPGVAAVRATGNVYTIKGVVSAVGNYSFKLQATSADTKIAPKESDLLTIKVDTDLIYTEDKYKCFIATAAYGSYLDPRVEALRKFRDDFLLSDFVFRPTYAASGSQFTVHNNLGRYLVRCYYEYSPPVAKFIARHEILRFATRVVLTPVVFAISYAPYILPAVLIFPYWLVISRRRKRGG